MLERLWREVQSQSLLPLVIPPALFTAQFALFAGIGSLGFPDPTPERRYLVGAMISLMFALTFLALLGMGIGCNQLLLHQNKVAPALGIVVNGVYFLGFTLFFITVFVTHSTT